MKAFFKAVKKGNAEKTAALLKKRSDLVHAQDEEGFTPLMWAAHMGYLDITKLLIEHGANVKDIHAATGSAIVHFAAEGGNIDLLKLLIDHNADIHQPNIIDKSSVLHSAVLAGKDAMLTALIDTYFCDVNAKTIEDDTPAHFAVKTNNLFAVQKLLQRGAEAAAKNKDAGRGYSILEIALNHWKLDIVHCICAHLRMDANDYLQSRVLANIFNHPEICKLLAMDGNNYVSGGFHLEALTQLTTFLSAYLDYVSEEELFDIKNLKKVYMRLLNFKSQQYDVVAHAREENNAPKITLDSPYFVTGFNTHAVYGSILPQEGEQYSISLYERGYFAKKIESKVFSIWRIQTNGQQLIEEVMQHFHIATDKNSAEASCILFNDIPSLLNTSYEYETRIKQNPFQHGHCYFENLKSLLLDELIQSYGIYQGKLIYKHFDLFMHCMALNEFNSKTTHVCKESIKDIAKNIIFKKNNKLAAIDDSFVLIEETKDEKKSDHFTQS